jgi:Flp pilus assembly protein CpaB
MKGIFLTMNKRLVIKTSLICTGIFVILATLAIFIIFSKYGLDTEKRHNVIVANTDIAAGDILKESDIGYITVRESAMTSHMLTDPSHCMGSKAIYPVKSGDYILSYNFIAPGAWHKADDKTIVMPVNIDDRLANLVRKGSIIDIKVLPGDKKSIPETVLSYITVEDVLDENGTSPGDALGNRKAYAVITLDEKQRDRLYAAQQVGKLIYELYCDPTQPKAAEDFEIPPEFFETTPAGTDSLSNSKGEKAQQEGLRDSNTAENMKNGQEARN